MRLVLASFLVWNAAACGACEDESPTTASPTARAQGGSRGQTERAQGGSAAHDERVRAGDPAGGADGSVNESPDSPSREDVFPLSVRGELALGARHGCVLRDDGRVACWGAHRFAQLGPSSSGEPGPGAARSHARPVEGIDDAARIVAGSWHTCVLRRGGTVACWGHGGFGQLGQDDRDDHAAPADVRGLAHVVEIAAGRGHTCARRLGGEVRCWGDNAHGQLGTGDRTRSATPVPVKGTGDATGLAAGDLHTCARLENGDVACWGMAVDGQLGTGKRGGRRGDHPAPVRVALDAPATAIAAGGVHTCAHLKTGAVACWGSNDAGQLGNGAGGKPEAVSARPVTMELGHLDAPAVQQLALGGRHTCMRVEAGTVACAGFNHFGQLGDGTRDQRRKPKPIEALDGVAGIAAGSRHTCALRGEGAVVCWGANNAGQLGDGTTERRLEPAAVQGL